MEWRVAGCEGVDERGEKTHLEKPVKAPVKARGFFFAGVAVISTSLTVTNSQHAKIRHNHSYEEYVAVLL